MNLNFSHLYIGNLPAAGLMIESTSLSATLSANLPAAGPMFASCKFIYPPVCRLQFASLQFPAELHTSLLVALPTNMPAALLTNLLHVVVVLKMIQPTWLDYDLSLWGAAKLRFTILKRLVFGKFWKLIFQYIL